MPPLPFEQCCYPKRCGMRSWVQDSTGYWRSVSEDSERSWKGQLAWDH